MTTPGFPASALWPGFGVLPGGVVSTRAQGHHPGLHPLAQWPGSGEGWNVNRQERIMPGLFLLIRVQVRSQLEFQVGPSGRLGMLSERVEAFGVD